MKKAKLGLNGRVVIPKPLCKVLNIVEGSPLIITLKDDAVVIRSDQSTCGLCGSPIESERTLRLCDECINKALKYHNANHKDQ
jgi:AbrB family looped-hinge helix DNA binding protein